MIKNNIKYSENIKKKIKNLLLITKNEYDDNKMLIKVLFKPKLRKKYKKEIKQQLKENLYISLNIIFTLAPGSIVSLFVLNKIFKIKILKTFNCKNIDNEIGDIIQKIKQENFKIKNNLLQEKKEEIKKEFSMF